jgi:phenylalanyl-tRNA synthetase beta chain
MLFSTTWLSRYVELPETTRTLTDLLTSCGLVVDQVDEVRNDTVLDLDVASNRVDAMNHFGVAREIATARREPLRAPVTTVNESANCVATDLASIEIEDFKGCRRFVARVIRNVEVGPSPSWMVELLEAIGLRPINNIVDITNFVMWELGHPLHAYDLDLLADNKIIVRRAAPGEALETLDGIGRELTADDLVIADAERAVGLAGVMGGADTEIRAGSSNVLLEGAWFDPQMVRRSAQRLGMHTDASHRFERTLALDGMVAAVDRAAALMADLASGQVCQGRLDVKADIPAPLSISLRHSRVERLLGVEVPAGEIRNIFERLSFDVEATADGFQVVVPRHRSDISREEDLVEEVARHYGYERLPNTLPALHAPEEAGDPMVLAQRRLQQVCVAAGYREALTMSLGSREDQAAFLPVGQEPVELSNPISKALGYLRALLIPGLLRAVVHNINRGQLDIRLFEIGNRFLPPAEGDGVIERKALALIICGPGQATHWGEMDRAPDLFDLKGALEAVARRMGWPVWQWRADAVPGLEDGCSAELLLGDERRGWAGKIAADVAERFGLTLPVWAAEVDIEDQLLQPPRELRYEPLSRFPGGVRDASLQLDEAISFDQIAAAIVAQQEPALASYELLDLYQGEDIPTGQRSLTLRFTYRRDDRTLTAEEIDSAHRGMVSHLLSEFGGKQR